MKVVHIGMGDYGFGWFEALSDRGDISLAGIVDLDETTHQKARNYKKNEAYKFYTDAGAAMDECTPDFIVNATPPEVHKIINHQAYLRNIPVLCEKPIAESYDDALEVLAYAESGHKIAIAENYRYISENRFVKEFTQQNHLKDITNIRIDFRKHHSKTNYHKNLLHPLLLDVSVHHLDLLRYFTNSEAERIYADFYTPKWSWYLGYSNAVICLTMKNGIKVYYNGSLDAHDDETSWYGNWAFTGKNGVLRYDGNEFYLSSGKQTTPFSIPHSTISDKDAILDDFIAYLQTEKLPPTHIFDNIKTFNIACAALRSFELKREVKV